jgi:hypothetical protein
MANEAEEEWLSKTTDTLDTKKLSQQHGELS